MNGKRVVLGVGGGIAAYKVADLASKLTQAGADVHAVLTTAATKFVAPLTFQALTHNPALTSLWVDADSNASGHAAGMPHIALADSADLVLIAPATADLLARLATGMADDLITTLVLATKAPVWVAPAMNPTMLQNAATQANLATLAARGFGIVDPESGRMACEHYGSGRLPETATLVAAITEYFARQAMADGAAANGAAANLPLAGKSVLVTAGPTREALDPVRYISNRSSGKMGYAIAAAAARRGATVTLVSGPTALPVPPGVTRVEVTTALQMHAAALSAFPSADFLVAAAAPADFRAAAPAAVKMKRGAQTETQLTLVANPDIVAECAALRRPGQIVIGFAAETGDPVAEAKRKLRDKNLDAIVANDVTALGAGFEGDTNRVVWVTARATEPWPLLTKDEVAGRIWDQVAPAGKTVPHETV